MGDPALILVPVVVLTVVLLLGFAGCEFEHGAVAPPTPELTFHAEVPSALTAMGGVKFAWTRPGAMAEEEAVAASPISPLSVEAYIATGRNLGPSLFWTLGADHTLTDLSPGGHDGSPLGGVSVGGDGDGPTDFSDATATLFDGNDDGIGSSYNPFVGTTARTFVGWARWEPGGAGNYELFGSSAGDNNRPNLRLVVATQDLAWRPSGDDGQVVTWPAAAPAAGAWFMWALRANPGNANATLFIDGASISQQAITESWPGSPGTFQAAVGATNRHPFKGAQGLVAVYEKALTDAEVAQLYGASRDVAVYEYQIQTPEPGSWLGRCEMTVQADSQTASDNSDDWPFFLTAENKSWETSFVAEGSPLGPAFEVRYTGTTQKE
jgi:concanavalin A-like lectin/glucanase superfamily protein